MKLWEIAVRRVNWKPTKLSFICSKHFKDEDFIRKKDENQRAKLKKGAIPSVFDFPKHLMKERKVRSAPKKRNITSAEKHQRSYEVHKKNILHDHTYAHISYTHQISILKSKILRLKKKYKIIYQYKCRKEQEIGKLKSLLKEMKEKGTILPETEAIVNSFDSLAAEIIKMNTKNRGKRAILQ